MASGGGVEWGGGVAAAGRRCSRARQLGGTGALPVASPLDPPLLAARFHSLFLRPAPSPFSLPPSPSADDDRVIFAHRLPRPGLLIRGLAAAVVVPAGTPLLLTLAATTAQRTWFRRNYARHEQVGEGEGVMVALGCRQLKAPRVAGVAQR